ncbi:hypothetical protein CLOP_g8051 [Closterium sp. NIES-67]|nr:hypothetical protein CLOP_g8051 [Closterium sp. NIES-67]
MFCWLKACLLTFSLCGDCRRQTKGKDYDEVFAPVGKGTTLRVLLAIAALLGWKIRHMDIVTAFLNGIIMEEVYMKLAGMSVH